jgi:hypothetical protein
MVDNHLDDRLGRSDNLSHRRAFMEPIIGSARPCESGGLGPVSHHTMKDKIRSIYASGDMQAMAQAQDEMAADDIVQEWPQSGERIRGKDNIRAVNENYPTGSGMSPKASLRRVLEPGEAWVIEGTIDYGDGVPVSSVSIIETGADGKVIRQTDYFASPFPAPEWRKKWVEQMEPITVG